MVKKQTHATAPDQGTLLAMLYDGLMEGIEPELMTTSLPLLAELYEDETDEERETRQTYYKQCYKQFNSMWSAYMGFISSGMHAFRKNAMERYLAMSQEEDAAALQSLESSFSDALPS